MLDELRSASPGPHSRGLAAASSIAAHGAAMLLAMWIATLPRRSVPLTPARASSHYDLTWLVAPGLAAGGGGSGDRSPAATPMRQAGPERLSVPVQRSQPKPTEKPKDPPPVEPLTIPVKPVASALDAALGVVTPTPSPLLRSARAPVAQRGRALAGAAAKGKAPGSARGQAAVSAGGRTDPAAASHLPN